MTWTYQAVNEWNWLQCEADIQKDEAGRFIPPRRSKFRQL
jgi:hypothetical protein